MMNILVTGGVGYIGSHTVLSLIKNNYKPIIVDNLENSHRMIINRLKKKAKKNITFLKGDILDSNFINKIFKNYKIKIVIHFAGYKSVAESMKVPVKYYQNNVTGTLNILKSMNSFDVSKIIFSSSATIYGNPKFLPITEKHPLNAINVYGQTKIDIENMLLNNCKANKNFSAISLRYFNPIGSDESITIGEYPKNNSSNLMPSICLAAKKNLIIKIYGTNYNTKDGTAVRDYIHVTDIADGHVSAIKYIIKNRGWNFFNLGTGKGTTVLEIIKTFEEVNNINLKKKFYSRRAGDSESTYASVYKAKKALNWSAKYDLKTMCKSAWEWSKRYC
jgi:UDP-glucose 4-epimerase